MLNAQTIPQRQYADLLKQRGMRYTDSGPWLTVGKADPRNKWVLFLPVKVLQTFELLQTVLPVLIEKKIPCRIIRNQAEHFKLNGGNYGHGEIGKAITLFPATDQQAKEIVSILLPLTDTFKGVAIANSIRLGKIIYTAREVPSNSCPFTIPKQYRNKKRQRIIGRWYVPISSLKLSPKGDIYKCIHLLKLKWCIVKQGKANIAEDSSGRDIKDRIIWEQSVLKNLPAHIPTPKIIDYFTKGEDCYLVMEYFEGIPLSNKIQSLLLQKPWKQIAITVQKEILSYYLQAVQIIMQLHASGYVHRDINDNNFIILPGNKVAIIDLEIAYCLSSKQPDPPFYHGYPNYVAPEQLQYSIPTVHEDTYSMGMLLVYMMTGTILTDCKDRIRTKTKLQSLTNDPVLTDLIVRCLNVLPQQRPSLHEVYNIITAHIEILDIYNTQYKKAI
jgi:hypothetical protein